MFFSSKKQDVSLEKFCETFYEKSILNPQVGEGKVDVLSTLAQTDKRLMAEADSNFANVDAKKLETETVILRFELFGLVWMHLFGPDFAVRVSLLTRDYLRTKDRSGVWESMGTYNQQIYRSTLSLKKKMGTNWEKYVIQSNRTRLDLFTKYLDQVGRHGTQAEQDANAKCIARALNHLFTEDVWKSRATAACFMVSLCDRLGYGPEFVPNEQGRLLLAAIITGFYDGARQAISKIKPK